MASSVPVYTLGHANRSLEELCRIVESLEAGLVADVRRWPRSRRNPQFAREALEAACRERGIAYTWIPLLGGYRRPGPGAPTCFRSPGFNAYLQHIATREAQAALEQIVYPAMQGMVVVVLCAELHPWRCHRKIIADWLVIHGVRVVHVIDGSQRVEHRGTRCINVLRRLLAKTRNTGGNRHPYNPAAGRP